MSKLTRIWKLIKIKHPTKIFLSLQKLVWFCRGTIEDFHIRYIRSYVHTELISFDRSTRLPEKVLCSFDWIWECSLRNISSEKKRKETMVSNHEIHWQLPLDVVLRLFIIICIIARLFVCNDHSFLVIKATDFFFLSFFVVFGCRLELCGHGGSN